MFQSPRFSKKIKLSFTVCLCAIQPFYHDKILSITAGSVRSDFTSRQPAAVMVFGHQYSVDRFRFFTFSDSVPSLKPFVAFSAL